MRRLWIMLGIVLLVGTLAGCGGGRSATAAPIALAAKSYGFKVDIAGLGPVESASDVQGIAMIIGSKEYVSGNGRDRVSVPDGRRPTVLTFALDLDDELAPEIQSWVKDVYDGRESRKDITIELLAPDRTSIQRVEFFDCWPSKWSIAPTDADAAGGTVVKWRLEVRVNRISMS